ncbi:MAG: TonB-dependent receptor [Gammaproteobacteria bacterium]|nr:TonB-dependent receptor [Gammaproteobacteria bacterium]
MKTILSLAAAAGVAFCATLALAPLDPAYAQDRAEEVEEIVVTGSRIRRDPLNEPTAIMEIGAAEIEETGLTNLGDALQNLPITGSAPNSQFNVPGNSGFPQDGAGIGAGSVQLSLRNIGAKRTLVLVDGKRWIAGASASGVPSTVDLNTIPDNVIERIEILQDGASAIYGSDAIGGVVNVITNRSFEGFRIDAQTGGYLSDSDGESSAFGLMWGGGNETTHVVLSGSWRNERGIETANRKRSAFPNPNATSCDVPGSFCSSFTPQGRFVLGPNFNFWDGTLNDGVLNNGTTSIPVFDPSTPDAGDFNAFDASDRFNYNGPGFNYLRTPNERVNLYASARHEFSENIRLIATASYTNRTSATKAAPEPLCLGNGCGNRINDNFLIHADNPFNPFGVDLSVANGNLEFFGRRPLESGGRLFFQDVNTYFVSTGLEGEFEAGDRNFYWDLFASYGDNRGFQEKYNSHNAAKLQIAMGDPAVCAATPNCVPFNFFGGQGPNGTGSITQAMLDYVTYTQRDFSEQTLQNFSFNIGGDMFDVPAGTVGFAAGIEYRDHKGSFRPDPIAERGETAGIPSGATAGEFDVTEFYGEVNVPLIAGDQYWEVNAAARSSDYSTSGSEATYKVSTLYRPIDQLSLRASVSTGFRAPGIGELFGGAAREDFTFLDPCADVLAQAGSANGGRDTAQPANIIANCANPAVGGSNSAAGFAGVPVAFIQNNPSLSSVSAGNEALTAETSDSFTVGAVWSTEFNASWIEALTISLDYYNLEIDDAVSSRDASDVLTACVNTLDPLFCDLTPRTSSGALDVIDNQLQNIGGIESSGYDLMVDYTSPEWNWGQINASLNASFLDEYNELTAGVDGSVTTTDRKGTHTNETFQRAFPELRTVTTINWLRENWSGSLAFRWVDEMDLSGGTKVDSVMFTDLRVSYTPSFADENLTIALGFNNVFDEDPPICFPCGVIGMSIVSHDLPGRVGYIRFSYRQ